MLIKRYEKYAARESQEEIGEDMAVPEGGSHDAPEASAAGPRASARGSHGAPEVSAADTHASDNPMMVMVDESTGNRYMRAVPTKG